MVVVFVAIIRVVVLTVGFVIVSCCSCHGYDSSSVVVVLVVAVPVAVPAAHYGKQ